MSDPAHQPSAGTPGDPSPVTAPTTPAESVRAAIVDGRCVVVHGDAGIGKSRLLDEALSMLPADDAVAVVDLPSDLRDDGAQVPLLHRLLGPDLPTVLLPDRLAAWARSAAGGATPLLRVEGAQLLDDVSAHAIGTLAAGGAVGLVATTRSDPLLVAAFPEIPADRVERFTLRPLDTASVEAVLIDILGGYPTEDTVHRLWAASAGNPFQLLELVRDQRERGTLVERDGIWVWTGARAVSRGVLDAVLHDLALLGPGERAALELVAVAGPLPADAAQEPAGPAGLHRLLRLGLLRAVSTGIPTGASATVQLVHPAYADVVSAQISARRRREIAERARRWHEDPVGGPATDPGRRPGGSASVPRVLDASHAAVLNDDPSAAVELTSAALRNQTADLDRVAILTARSDAHLHLQDTDAALADLAAARTALESLPPSEHVLAAHARTVRLEAMTTHFLRGDLDETLQLLDRAATWLARDTGPERDRSMRAMQAMQALRLAHLAWHGLHAEMLEDALALLAQPGHPEDLLPLAGPTGYALAHAGRFPEAADLCRRFDVIARSGGDMHRWEPSVISLVRLCVLVWSGRLEEAQAADAPSASLEDTVPAHQVDRVGLHQRRGILAAARGDWGAARTDLRAANARLRLRDSLGILAHSLSWEAYVAAASGDTRAAIDLVDEIELTPRRCSLVTGAEIDLHVIDALIWADDPRALTRAADLAHEARRDGLAGVELEALHRLTLLAGAPTVRGVLGGDPGAHVEVLRSRVDGPRQLAMLDHLHAMITQQQELVDGAAAALARTGLRLPTGTSAGMLLTAREHEIAGLAAGGMSSRAIAQRLTLSVRTVDSHLSNAFTKLGLHSRAGLEQALGALRMPRR